MKKLLIIGLCLWSALLVNGQQLTYEFSYDNAGNRICRTIIQLNSKNEERENYDELCHPLSDVMGNGTTMKLFPNPTKEYIRFELNGNGKIGKYVLSDITGRIIRQDSCETPSLTLDLSDQREGIYLLELFVEEKPYIYKVIKQ